MKKRWIVFPLALALITGLMLMAAGCDSNVNSGNETKTLSSIAVTNPPNKVQYNLGDTEDEFDTEGMVVTATYSDGSTAPVTGYMCTGFSSTTPGIKTITVTYDGKETSFSINVIDPNRETVATPVASPLAGPVPSNTRITLSTTTPGAEIWYTTNGSDPEKNVSGSSRYITTIAVTAAVTIKAVAVREGMNDSGVMEAAYTVQTGNGYTVTQSGGILHKQDSDRLLFAFTTSIPRGGLSGDDITVIDGTGKITKVLLQDTAGPSRILYIEVNKEGTVKIKITREGISDAEVPVEVYKKTGFEPDPTVTITDIVKMRTPALPTGSPITFARNDGDPIAILPPRTTAPISSISAASPAFEQVLAVFDPPLDLTTGPTSDFRWFDMVWDGFGSTYEFDGTTLNLHMVIFQLELTTTDNNAIVLEKRSDTDTSTGAKVPVRFLKSDIQASSTAWGTGQGSGHRIKTVTVRAVGMQFRNVGNSAWPSLSATNAPVIEDTWISSLTVHTVPASLSKVLYSSDTGWSNDITNPRWALRDIGSSEEDATVLPQWTGVSEEQKIVYWDPIDTADSIVNTADGFTAADEYGTIIITYTGATHYWYGYGSMSGDPADGAEIVVKQQSFDGSAISPASGIRIPLRSAGYTPNNFDGTKFSGFFLQWNSGNITITGIRLE